MNRLSLVPLLGLALGCAAAISTELREPNAPLILRKLVIMPFATDPAPGGSVPVDAAAVVATRVLEAMTQETRLEIVPPGEAARVRGGAEVPSGEELRRQFGVDAVLTGSVRRYVERIGGPAGASRPAAVWFSLELRSPDGEILWSGTYDETQRALSEDLGSFGRAWRRGFRWVTAADLAGYGARQLARALAAETVSWS
jgi:hypothetical protein